MLLDHLLPFLVLEHVLDVVWALLQLDELGHGLRLAVLGEGEPGQILLISHVFEFWVGSLGNRSLGHLLQLDSPEHGAVEDLIVPLLGPRQAGDCLQSVVEAWYLCEFSLLMELDLH